VPGPSSVNPDLAKAFRLIQQQGRDAFYKADRRAISRNRKALGGPIDARTSPITRANGYRRRSGGLRTATHVSTRAPSQHGHLEALNVLEQCVPTWYPGQTLDRSAPAKPALLGTP